MTSTDFDYFDELASGRYSGVVDKIRYRFTATTKIIITYKIETAGGVRRLTEEILINAPKTSVSYFHTTRGLNRVEDLLRIRGLTFADADGLKALPGLLEGTELAIIVRQQRVAGFNVPVVMRVEKP